MSGFARYARQIVLPEVGVGGQDLLKDSHVLVLGLGGLGSVASLYLAGAGVGRLSLVDSDRVEQSNLQRQISYTQDDIGRDKAQALRERLLALNPEIEVRAEVARAEASNLRPWIAEADIVLDCSDNFPTRFAINAACVAARKPLVSAAALRFEAQLVVFDSAHGGPCYRCLYADDVQGGEAQERCEDAGVLGPVVGAAGSLQALLCLKHLLGIRAQTGCLYLWEARDMDWRKLSIARDPACPVCAVAA